jgi:hypothetical protein
MEILNYFSCTPLLQLVHYCNSIHDHNFSSFVALWALVTWHICIPKWYQSVYFCPLPHFLVRILLLGALWTAASGFGANTCSAREHTVFAPALLLYNWRERWPSNQSDLDCSVTGEVEWVYYKEVDLLLVSFLCRNTCFLFRIKWYICMLIVAYIFFEQMANLKSWKGQLQIGIIYRTCN